MGLLWIKDPDPVFSQIRIRMTQKDRIRFCNTAFMDRILRTCSQKLYLLPGKGSMYSTPAPSLLGRERTGYQSQRDTANVLRNLTNLYFHSRSPEKEGLSGIIL